MSSEDLLLVLLHIVVFVVGTVFYVSLFHTSLFVGMNVLFYRGIALLMVASLVTVSLLWGVGAKFFPHLIIGRDLVIAFVVHFSVNIVFFTHVPVTADRSVTVFVLSYMNHHQASLSKEELEKYFVGKYVHDYDAMHRRMDEQMVIGTVEKLPDGNYKLTPKGKRLMQFYSWVSDYYGLDRKFIDPN